MRKKGSLLVEVCAGAVILVPIALVSVDLIAEMIGVHNTDRLARNAARAAGNQTSAQDGESSARYVIKLYTSPLMQVRLTRYEESANSVTVHVSSSTRLPVPVFNTSTFEYSAKDTQPIVARPAAY